MERFSELGELAELFESLDVDINGDAIMQLLVGDLFGGVFDPADPDAVPSRYAKAEFQDKQILAIPTLSFLNRVHLMSGRGRGSCSYIYGSSRMIVPVLHQVKALPIEAPEKLTTGFVDEACTRLAELPIDQFDDRARDVLDCIMVDRTTLRTWFEAKGMMTPADKQTGYDLGTFPGAANSNDPVQLDLVISEEESVRPGRPESDLWPRVQELVSELHTANPEAYNNAMASEIHELLVAEFPDQKVLALTTIQGKMMALRDQARADLDESQDQV